MYVVVLLPQFDLRCHRLTAADFFVGLRQQVWWNLTWVCVVFDSEVKECLYVCNPTPPFFGLVRAELYSCVTWYYHED